jgi:hypothetical protein
MAKKKYKTWLKPRNEKGRFTKVIKVAPAPVMQVRTPEERAETMRVLYQWRDQRREYANLAKRAAKEERYGGLRSIALFTAMSAVMVGLLFAGVVT